MDAEVTDITVDVDGAQSTPLFHERISDMESTIPVLPVTVPATGGGFNGPFPYSCNGLEGKDASFIVGLSNEVGHRDNIRDVLENRFQVERMGRDLDKSQHQLEMSNQKILSELKELVKTENEKTRTLLEQRDKDKMAADLAQAKMELCMLEHACPAPVVTPLAAICGGTGTATVR